MVELLAALLGTLLAAVICFGGWLVKRIVDKLDDHVTECNQIPKQVLLSKLETIDTKIDRVESKVTKIDETVNKHEVALAVLNGKALTN